MNETHPASAQPLDALAAWTGRHDGEGPSHARWHELVAPAVAPEADPATADGSAAAGEGAVAARGPVAEQEHIALLGFASDEGVRRNAGRVGAAEGPTALRRALAPLALHGPLGTGERALLDHGDAVTRGEDLETGQEEAAALLARALDAPGCRLAVVLGGGHETAWASYRGLQASRRMAGPDAPRWGVLNLDAHFDLREAERPTSGTPFAQMALAEREAGRDLCYAVLGIAEPSNTNVLFERARELGVRWMTDLEVLDRGPGGVAEFVEEFARDLDVLYLTIDLDVLPAATAPGVSAPAGLGVPLPLIATAVRTAASTGKLALLDVVELNPRLDQDQRTARAAARLIDLAVTRID